MRKRIGILAVAAAATVAWAASALPAFGDSGGDVTAQVTVASVCLTITPTSLDFGTQPFSRGAGGPDSASRVIDYFNCSAAEETVSARGTNATGGSGVVWQLLDSGIPCLSGLNTYMLPLFGGETPVNLSTTDQTLGTLASHANQSRQLDLLMPCTGSDGAGETMTFHVVFTATA